MALAQRANPLGGYDANGDGYYDSPAVTVLRTWLPILIAKTLKDDIPAEDFAAFSGTGYLGEVQPLALTSINYSQRYQSSLQRPARGQGRRAAGV